jgi:hypothetical protein
MDLWPHKKVPNDNMCERLGVTPIKEKLMQHCLRWFEHIQRRTMEASIRSTVIRWTSNGKRQRKIKHDIGGVHGERFEGLEYH